MYALVPKCKDRHSPAVVNLGKLMKNLIFITGPNGVGKSSACQILITQELTQTAYIDSDWCRCMHPFSFTAQEKLLVTANITTLMLNYLRADAIRHLIFSCGLHGPRRQIWRDILYVLNESSISYRLCPLILTCSETENVYRMTQDRHDSDRIDRALKQTRAIYDNLPYPRLDNTALDIAETARRMMRLLTQKYAINLS